MSTDKQLYRSRNALLGGVCSGVAEYFDLDPVVMRILAVVITLLTAGLFAVAYVALWVVLPLAPKTADPVEVRPHSVQSDTYGSVTFESPRSKDDAAVYEAARTATGKQSAQVPFVGAGHTPPEPPPHAATWAQNAQAPRQNSAWQAPGWYTPDWKQNGWTNPSDSNPPSSSSGASQSIPPATPVGFVPPQGTPPLRSDFATPVAAEPARKSGRGVTAAVWLGSLVLSLGVAAFLAQFIDNISWWQFWPLIPATVGIALMVVPGKPGRRMAQFVNGLMLFALGGALLPMSLEVVSWDTVGVVFTNLWPLLVIMAGFFIISSALHSAWLRLLAGLCFVLFCLAGIWFAIPGVVEAIVLELPFDRELSFPFKVIVLRHL